MADDTVSSQPADSGASLKKKGGKKNMMIIAVVVVVVLALVAVVVLGGFLSSDEEYDNALDRIQSRGKIVVGTQVPYPPFEDINATTDELEGIDMDIMAYIAAKLNVTIEYKTMDFDPLFAAVQIRTDRLRHILDNHHRRARRGQRLHHALLRGQPGGAGPGTPAPSPTSAT